VEIPAAAAARIRVRFPSLDPGSLIDVIGIRLGGTLEAHVPATSQPAYLATRVARRAAGPGAAPGIVSGSAVWHEPAMAEPLDGMSYPAVDPQGCCQADDTPAALPLLAVGSVAVVRNECTGLAASISVTGCGPVARMYHDRCTRCGTSPRGRVADLTMASFARLGGDLERGCFNATLTLGRSR
jgi:hypothetical protein